MTASIVADAEDWVKSELAGQDGSHDWWHIARVRATALSLAREESLPESSMLTVELAALLHDVRDWKYSGDANAGAEAVSSWLEEHGHPADDIRSIVKIISNVGFKDELVSSTSSSASLEMTPEFKVVQDADRLDAIGALVRRQRRRAATTRCTHAEEAEGRRLLTSVTYALRSFSAESGISAPSSRFLLTSSSSPLARNFKSTVSCGSLYTRVRTGRGRWGGTSALASVARASHRMLAGGHRLLSR